MMVEWKILLIAGLGISFAGLVLMSEAKLYRKLNNGKIETYISTGTVHTWMNRAGWFCTIGGYILQIWGTILAQ